MRTRFLLLVLALPGGSAAQSGPELTPEAYAARLREIIAQAPHLAMEATPIPVVAPAAEWKMGMVSWVTADRTGLTYLLQRGDQADPVVVLDSSGRVLRSWGRGLYRMPHAIRLDPEGNVWTADAKSSMIRKFTPEGRQLLQIAVGDVPADCGTNFCGTTDIGFGPNGSIYIADGYKNARIVEFTAKGERVREWGRPGSGPGEFQLPHSVVVGEEGVVYVADRENGRVQLFDLKGNYLREWPSYGKTFSLALAPGAIWLATQHRNEVNFQPGWLMKVDRKTGAVLGYVNSTAAHGVHAGPGGSVRYAPGPKQVPQLYRP